MEYIEGFYNYQLVAISILVSILSAYVALDLRAFAAENRQTREKQKWLIISSIAMAVGIWAMHFIAMMAFQLPIPILYGGIATIASLLIAIVGCFLSFIIAIRVSTKHTLVFAALTMCAAIVGMHYTGMSAMHLSARMVLDPFLFAFSALFAVSASYASLFVMFPKGKILIEGRRRKIIAAILMGIAISGMHYTSMAATHFIPVDVPLTNNFGFMMEEDSMIVALATAVSALMFFLLYAKDTAYRKSVAITLEANILRKSEAQLRKLIQHLGEAIIVFDEQGDIKLFNKNAAMLFGYMPEGMFNKNVSQLIPELNNSEHSHFIEHYLQMGKSKIIDAESCEFEALHKHGHTTPVEIMISDTGKGFEYRFIGIIRDISLQKEKIERLESMANYDQLTNLFNRYSLNQRIEHAIVMAKRQKCTLAVMYLDLDGFKAVNDSFGHDVGDELLKKAAACLQQCVRESDSVGRLGGDEFCIVLEGVVDSKADSELVGEKILKLFSQPCRVKDYKLDITASIGVAIYPDDGIEVETLLKNADTAMYLAKKNGKNQLSFYEH